MKAFSRIASERIDARLDFCGPQEQLIRRNDRALDVGAPIFVTLLDGSPVFPQRASERGVSHEDGVFRQVVEERRRLVEEQRQIELDTRRREPLR